MKKSRFHIQFVVVRRSIKIMISIFHNLLISVIYACETCNLSSENIEQSSIYFQKVILCPEQCCV